MVAINDDSGWVKMDFYGGWWTIHGDWLWWMVGIDGGCIMVTMLMGELHYGLWCATMSPMNDP